MYIVLNALVQVIQPPSCHDSDVLECRTLQVKIGNLDHVDSYVNEDGALLKPENQMSD